MAEIPKISGIGNNTEYQPSKVGGAAPGPSFEKELQQIKAIADADVYTPKVGEVAGTPFLNILKEVAKNDDVVNTYLVLTKNNNIGGIGSSINIKDTDAVDIIANALTEQPFVKIDVKEQNKSLPTYLHNVWA